jgi:hypothetical protein
MIEETLAVYQDLYDIALAEEQAETDAVAVSRIKRSLKKPSDAVRKSPDTNDATTTLQPEPPNKDAKVKLLKKTPKTTNKSKMPTDSDTVQDDSSQKSIVQKGIIQNNKDL